jgi:hypothetical protein
MTKSRNFKTGNYVFDVKYTDLTGTAGLTQDVLLKTLPAGTVVKRVLVKIKTAFAGTTTLTGRVISAQHNYGTAYNLKTTPGAEVYDSDLTPFRELTASTVALNFHVVATVDNLTSLTAGEVQIVVVYDVENVLF